MSISTKQAVHFQTIFRTGSIREAAETLHLTQPALSRSLQTLENSLGLSLFERSRSGMVPTDFALRIQPLIEQLSCLLTDIDREAALFRGREPSSLTVGFGQAVRSPLVTTCVPRFSEQVPGVGFRVREGSQDELIEMLRKREIDMMIASADFLRYRNPEFLRHEQIILLELQVVMRKNHPLANARHITLDDLSSFPSAAATGLPGDHPFVRIMPGLRNPTYICSNYSVLRGIVERTDAWAAVPSIIVSDVISEQLIAHSVAEFDLKIDLSIIELINRTRSRCAQQFVDIVRKVTVGRA